MKTGKYLGDPGEFLGKRGECVGQARISFFNLRRCSLQSWKYPFTSQRENDLELLSEENLGVKKSVQFQRIKNFSETEYSLIMQR